MGEKPDLDLCSQCGNQFPPGMSCPRCSAPVPDLEEILRRSQGLQDFGAAIRGLAQVHADWRQAWEDTGKFSGEEAFELVRILVATFAGGLRALS